MKKLLPLLLLPIGLWAVVQVTAQDEKPADAGTVKLETNLQQASYAVGFLTSQNWKRQGADFDLESVIAGIRAGLDDKTEPLLKEHEMHAALKTYEGEMRKKMETKASAAAEANKQEGEAYLAANKGKEGVTTTASGLQYKVLKEGGGLKPTTKDQVSVHYKGILIDGTEFDSSYKRGQPATFPVTGVIKGWTEALQLMSVGSKYQLFIPSDLAYGTNPRPGGPIGPNAVLVFEVELVSIQGK